MARVVECEVDNKIVIVSNEPIGYPNFASENIRVSYAEFERLNVRYGGHYGTNWYFLGKRNIKYFDHQADKWMVVRR